jgi:hypothetical protein
LPWWQTQRGKFRCQEVRLAFFTELLLLRSIRSIKRHPSVRRFSQHILSFSQNLGIMSHSPSLASGQETTTLRRRRGWFKTSTRSVLTRDCHRWLELAIGFDTVLLRSPRRNEHRISFLGLVFVTCNRSSSNYLQAQLPLQVGRRWVIS